MTVLQEQNADARADLYPSRVDTQPSFRPRLDPVVYTQPDARRGPLTPAQLADYEQRGYLALPGFFAAQRVRTWNEELDRLRADPDICRRPEAILEPASCDLRSLFRVHELSSVFAKVAADAQIVAMVQQILGSATYIHQSRINLKPGFAGKEFYWHSDFETWHVEDGMPRMRAVSCSILLTDNHVCNGPLMLVPGSHRRFVACVGRTPANHYQQSLRRQEYGVPDQASLTQLVAEGGIDVPVGPAGTVILFDCNTMHGSAGNITPYPRTNLFLVYNSVENRLEQPWSGQPPRPTYIAARPGQGDAAAK